MDLAVAADVVQPEAIAEDRDNRAVAGHLPFKRKRVPIAVTLEQLDDFFTWVDVIHEDVGVVGAEARHRVV